MKIISNVQHIYRFISTATFKQLLESIIIGLERKKKSFAISYTKFNFKEFWISSFKIGKYLMGKRKKLGSSYSKRSYGLAWGSSETHLGGGGMYRPPISFINYKDKRWMNYHSIPPWSRSRRVLLKKLTNILIFHAIITHISSGTEQNVVAHPNTDLLARESQDYRRHTDR